MGKNYLVVDLGTGNSRVALVSEKGEIYGLRSIENQYYKDDLYEDAQYFIPEEWSNLIFKLCRDLITEFKTVKISGVTASGARETIVLIDQNGDDFYGLPNIDNRGVSWMETIPNQDKIYETTGRWVTADFPAGKLLGLKKKREELYKRIDKITSLSEWVGYLFTREIVIEPSQACETQLYDIGKMEWSKEICGYYGIKPEILPKVQNGMTCLGMVTDVVREYLGISYEVPFIVGGADTQVAVKGMGTKNGDVAVVSGTTSPVVMLAEEKFYDPKERCWTDCNLGGKNYQIETNTGVTGLNYQRLKKLLFSDVGYDEIDNEVAKKERFLCTASLATLLFKEERNLRYGGIFMTPPLNADLDRFDIAYAVLGDIACSIYYQYQNLTGMISHKKEYLYGCGGGFQSRIICQMLANLTCKELHLKPQFEQSSLVGCAKICNEYFKIESFEPRMESERTKVYQPDGDKLIWEYYEKWLENRKKVNINS